MSIRNHLTIQLLGPVTLLRGGASVAVRGQRQRRFLASLALQPGQVISKGAIIEDSWDGEPPLTVSGQLQTSAWMIRKALSEAGTHRDALGSHDLGYELRVPPECIDVFVFREAVRTARDLHARGEQKEAATRLDDALALWKGAALTDVTSVRLRMKGEALDRERMAAAELRALIDVSLGNYGEAIAELTELVERDPLREDLYVGLMKAYYGEGRQADAIHVFHRAKEILREQIGVSPGTRLREVMQAILRQDELVLSAQGRPTRTAERVPEQMSRQRVG
ncbi:BTAD domain-containing putative transcriptional regulator [Streptomyces sp. NPDC001941]|uniref:AfsR/SARP family transcriptional regulator n=1 Tax=Streptomyces sp. NPDC001941 TaxID=3154659 RepID=UPI0033308610